MDTPYFPGDGGKPYKVEPAGQPGIYVVRDEAGTILAEVRVPPGETTPVTYREIAQALWPDRPAHLVALTRAVNARIREVWPG